MDTTTTEIYTLSLHDALPISRGLPGRGVLAGAAGGGITLGAAIGGRSEEHTSELQSRGHLVCRLLLEKKKARICTKRNSHSIRQSRFVTPEHHEIVAPPQCRR